MSSSTKLTTKVEPKVRTPQIKVASLRQIPGQENRTQNTNKKLPKDGAPAETSVNKTQKLLEPKKVSLKPTSQKQVVMQTKSTQLQSRRATEFTASTLLKKGIEVQAKDLQTIKIEDLRKQYNDMVEQEAKKISELQRIMDQRKKANDKWKEMTKGQKLKK